MSVCSARSAAFSIGVIILSTVRKAARFAVYDDIIIRVKNHHMPPTILVLAAYNSQPPAKTNIELVTSNLTFPARVTCENFTKFKVIEEEEEE